MSVHVNVYLCAMCMPGTCRGQKRAMDALEVELPMVVAMCGCWKSKPDPLEERLVLLTGKPFSLRVAIFLLYHLSL